MKTIMKDKPRIVPVTDPDEIASLIRNMGSGGTTDIIGGWDKYGKYWAYAYSLERWRKSHAREKGKHE